jgi:hypothetical protein
LRSSALFNEFLFIKKNNNNLFIEYGITFMELFKKSGANTTSSGNKKSSGFLKIDPRICVVLWVMIGQFSYKGS